MAVYKENQLLFNLDVNPRASNLAYKQSAPQPIVIEKFGQNSTPVPLSHNISQNALQFSAVSEDSLASAVRLARRDLKKQREEESFNKIPKTPKGKKKNIVGAKYPHAARPVPSRSSVGGRPSVPARPGAAKLVHSKEYKAKIKKRAAREEKPLPVRERLKGSAVKSTGVQFKAKDAQRSMAVNMSNFQPGADVSQTAAPSAPLTGEEKILEEISRLRKEMDVCMQQISKVEEISKNNPSKPAKLVHAEDIEDERKRKMRADEQNTRSSRMVYQLNQQVKVIADEINKTGPEQLTAQKRNVILRKLAAAHRGSVRVLSTFVQHLKDFNLRDEGMPRSYHDLCGLMRQLSLVCAQLEVAGQTGVPDSVVNLIKHVSDMNEALNKEINTRSKSPARPCHQHKAKQLKKDRDKQVVIQGVPVPQPQVQGGPKRAHFEQSKLFQTDKPSAETVDRLRRNVHDKGIDATPDRSRALRAGIEALVRAADSAPNTPRPASARRPFTPRGAPSTPRGGPNTPRGAARPPNVPRLNLPRTPRSTARTPRSPKRGGVAWDVDVQEKRSKGILLPSRLEKKRARVQRSHVAPVPFGGTHYSDPTLASKLKEVEVLPSPPRSPGRYRSPSPRSPMRSPMRSPVRYSARSPGRYSARSPERYSSRSPGRYSARSPGRYSARSPGGYSEYSLDDTIDRAKREIARQVWEDRAYTRQERDINRQRRSERARVEQLRHRLGKPEEWVSDAERRIKEKLRPLLQQAEDILDEFESTPGARRGSSSIVSSGSRKTSSESEPCNTNQNNVEVNADMIADMLLGDMLEETVHERSRMEDSMDMSDEAMAWQDAPHLETLLQRLDSMEKEHENIRKRWATIVYEDELRENFHRIAFMDADQSNAPHDPPPVELVRHGDSRDDPANYILPGYSTRETTDPILFTKPDRPYTETGSIQLHGASGFTKHQDKLKHQQETRRTPIFLSQPLIEKIQGNKTEFEKHLKRNNYQSVGRFNPWQIVEEMSDEILNECLRDVAGELDDINNDIVHHVYKGEFSLVPSTSSQQPPPPGGPTTDAHFEQPFTHLTRPKTPPPPVRSPSPEHRGLVSPIRVESPHLLRRERMESPRSPHRSPRRGMDSPRKDTDSPYSSVQSSPRRNSEYSKRDSPRRDRDSPVSSRRGSSRHPVDSSRSETASPVSPRRGVDTFEEMTLTEDEDEDDDDTGSGGSFKPNVMDIEDLEF